MKITLRNNFHNTETTLIVNDDGIISKRQVKAAHDRLCGSDSCTCGNDFGARGPQTVELYPLGDGNYQVVK